MKKRTIATPAVDPVLLATHGPMIAAVVPASMGMYSPEEIADRGLSASASYEQCLAEHPELEDPVSQLAILICALENVETSGLMSNERLLALLRTSLGI